MAIAQRDRAALSIDLAQGAFRHALENGGRAHVDRSLPFLILNRYDADDAASLALRVAATGSAYTIWPAEAAADTEALATIEAVITTLHIHYKRVLLISLYDLPEEEWIEADAPHLPAFTARIGASDDRAAQAAAACLAIALTKLEVDLRHCSVEHVSKPYFEPGIEQQVDDAHWISHLSLGLPQNYRRADADGIYPQLFHDLSVGVFDALLQAFHAFFAAVAPPAPAHHRALGRSSFVTAARTVDRKIDDVCKSYDFLLSVSPINTIPAYEQFKADAYDVEPKFRYRPLTVDPELAKRALYKVDFRAIEDPVLETLFTEKRREVDQQLTMLACRNTRDFLYSSLTLYGPVEPELRAAALAILGAETTAPPDQCKEMIDCHAVFDAADKLVRQYREAYDGFRVEIALRGDIAPGLMVSGRKLLISTATKMRRRRLDALLQHEVSIHLLTYVNGNAQGLKVFRTGLAGYEGIQEGLGVFAECAVGGLLPGRLRLLAARVIIVGAMIDGGSFVDCFRLLHEGHGFGPRTAFNIVARVFRSGGFAKDAIYLRGFARVLAILASGQSLDPFWCGKIADHHIPVVEELELRGLLHRPTVVPAFLARPDAQARIEQMRTLPSLAKLI